MESDNLLFRSKTKETWISFLHMITPHSFFCVSEYKTQSKRLKEGDLPGDRVTRPGSNFYLPPTAPADGKAKLAIVDELHSWALTPRLATLLVHFATLWLRPLWLVEIVRTWRMLASTKRIQRKQDAELQLKLHFRVCFSNQELRSKYISGRVEFA